MRTKTGTMVAVWIAAAILVAGCDEEWISLGQYGEVCGDSGCASGLCVNVGSADRCSQPCDSSPCPHGDPCIDLGSRKVCKPSGPSAPSPEGGPPKDLAPVPDLAPAPDLAPVPDLTPVENTNTLCSDGKDNDGDSKTDCEDPDCLQESQVTICLDKCPGMPVSLNPKTGSKGQTYYFGTYGGSFTFAKPDYTTTACLWADGADLVFRVTAPISGKLSAQAKWKAKESYLAYTDAEIYFFVGSCPGPIKYNCTCFGCGPYNYVNSDLMGATAGTTYYIVLDTRKITTVTGYDLEVWIVP